MRFCFMFIIQQELDEITSMWNTHYIREVRNSEGSPGRPNILFFMPEQSNLEEEVSDFLLMKWI